MCAPPRRFSQLAAAFFAKIRLGIHLKPFSRLTILLFQGISSRYSLAPSLNETFVSLFVKDQIGNKIQIPLSPSGDKGI